MATTETVTPAQISYLTDLRDQLNNPALNTTPLGTPRIPARLCRTLASQITVHGVAKALRINKCEWLPAQDGDTADDIKARMLEIRARLASLTDTDIAALTKDEASAFISAAKVLA